MNVEFTNLYYSKKINFSKDFYTISRDYYDKKKKWDYEVYLNRFKTKLNNEEFRYEFLKVYKKFLISFDKLYI